MSVSTSRRSRGTSGRISRTLSALGKVIMPESPKIDRAAEHLPGHLAAAGEAVEIDRQARGTQAAVRFRVISWLLSRLCTTTGSPCSRATSHCSRIAAQLLFPRRVVVEKIEPALPHRHHLALAHQAGEARGMARPPGGGVVRMGAEGAPDVGVPTTQLEDFVGLLELDGRHQKATHAALAGGVERRLDLVRP